MPKTRNGCFHQKCPSEWAGTQPAYAVFRSKMEVFETYVYDVCTGVCYSTPSALNDECILKWGPSLHSPWAMNAASLGNIFTGSPIISMPFQFSWCCFLLSVSSWMQLAEELQDVVCRRQLCSRRATQCLNFTILSDNLAVLDSTAAHRQPLLVPLPPPPLPPFDPAAFNCDTSALTTRVLTVPRIQL